MLSSIGVANTHTNPYAALENPSPSDKINTQQTTDNLSNHARSAVIPQSSGDRAPLNAIMAMESAASRSGAGNATVAGMLDNFSLSDTAAVGDISCGIGGSATANVKGVGFTGRAAGFDAVNPATLPTADGLAILNLSGTGMQPWEVPAQPQQ